MERYNTAYRAGTATQTAEFDEGLRQYMLKVYNYMASGVLLTGIVAMVFGNMLMNDQQLVQTVFGTPLRWVIALAPLAFLLVLSFGINKMSSGTMQMLFWVYAGLMGLSLGSIFLVYTGASIAQTFFITAASFGALSLYGYTTKKSLSGWGTFLFMGVIGLIIASIVNIFLASSMLHFVISAAGVLIFAGLTAYDTQRIKNEYFLMSTGEMVQKGAIMGALTLYLDFVLLFQYLLSFLGDRE